MLQAAGLILYIFLVGVLFWRGNEIFGRINNYLGPVMVLTLLVTSAIICAIFAFGYPVILVWKYKKPIKAVKLVAFTALWLLGFLILIMTTLLILK